MVDWRLLEEWWQDYRLKGSWKVTSFQGKVIDAVKEVEVGWSRNDLRTELKEKDPSCMIWNQRDELFGSSWIVVGEKYSRLQLNEGVSRLEGPF